MIQLLEKLTHNFETFSPATPSAIENAEMVFNLKLPADYKAFLQFTNGLEGETTSSYLVLWSAEELVNLNQAYNVTEFVPNVIIFGSDGAEDAFGFETTNMTIVKFPFVGMGHIPNKEISTTFSDFLASQTRPENKGFFKRIFGSKYSLT